MNLYFIVNPAAKNGQSMKIWKKIEQSVKSNQIPFEVYFTKQRGDGKTIARSILENTNNPVTIVPVGGDGTVNEVVDGIHPFNHGILGFIPAGSGNDFSRGFSLPNHPKQAFQRLLLSIKNHSEKKYDIGQFTIDQKKGIFINNLGCGFDAQIAIHANQSKLKQRLNRIFLGKLVYVFYLIKELLTFQPSKLTIQVDGNTTAFDKAWFATVCNHPFFGGGMKISPASKPDDGQFEVIVVHNISRMKVLSVFLTVFWGGHTKMKEVSILKGKKVTILNEASFPVHADGEEIGKSTIAISIHSEAVSILVNE
ncbi:diacylglycerol kinase family lipid kinase [Caldibacillus lycopersici]|uniref:diacylglycerol kinase (ATP) n=1 Tax=Perspicuibacillus lycopersici TaxID=1325689 RepID=A0AAE3IVA7_9BACI|nr:diacylglycerol kinase family protein [Perspicuibacillus lycopersici]MCU9614253.1 diacylglycerol kinase family lipid kinase [Perspicuibacillus lycopersici]